MTYHDGHADDVQPLTPEDVGALVAAATAAPSIHNSQPWRFRDVEDRIELHRDLRRSLPVADASARESVISCGAALFDLRLAMSFAVGHEPIVELLPEPADPEHLATLTRGPARQASSEEVTLYRAIPQRHSYRRAFAPEPVSRDSVEALRAAAAAEGAALEAVTTPEERAALIDLSAAAGHWLLGDPAYRGELARWTRWKDSAPDGVSVEVMGDARYPVNGLPWALAADPEVAMDELARHPLLVLTTVGDTVEDWLRAGQALQRVLLTATASGLVVSLFTQAVEVAATRAMLVHHLQLRDAPQVILRVGHPAGGLAHTARRRLASTFVRTPGADS